MVPSADCFKNATVNLHTRLWFRVTRKLALQLSAAFKIFMPKKYAEFRRAFLSGRWFMEDPGPFLGRVLVFKLQLYAHFDSSEAGPSISFPSGFYNGGHFEAPQLGIRFL